MSKENQDKLLLLMDEAMNEGVQSMAATINKAKDDAYMEGYRAALKDLPIAPTTDEEGDGIPVHNVEPQATFDYLNEVPAAGYEQTDYSKIWPYTSMVQERSDASWTEKCRPYCFYGKGDEVVVECDDEPTQTVKQYKTTGFFRVRLLTPNKTYRWRMLKSGKVIDSGVFKTVGRVKWIGTKYPHNFRDLGFTGYIKYGRVYRSQNFLKVVVDDEDCKVIRDHLNITTQLNLTSVDDDKSPSRTDIFDKCYNYNIPAYDDVFTASTDSKKAFRQALEALANELEAGHNVVFNCWQGVDRTGTFAWVVQALCGLPLGYCEAGWELSSFCRDLNTKIWDNEPDGLILFIKKLADKYVAAQKKKNEDTSYDAYKLAYYLVVNFLGASPDVVTTIRKYLCE